MTNEAQRSEASDSTDELGVGLDMRNRIVAAMTTYNDFAVSTWRIARLMREPTRRVRRELHRMQRDGQVVPHSGSTCNNIIWRLTTPNDTVSGGGTPSA